MKILEITIVIFLSGLMGYLINYLADVLPLKRKLTRPICLHCGEHTGLLRYLTFGVCKSCGKAPPVRRWLVVVFVIVAALFYWFFPLRRLDYFTAMLLLGYFVLIVIIDVEYRVVLDITSLFGALGAFLLGWKVNGLEATLVGAPTGFGIMLAFYWLGILFARWISKRRGEEVDEVALGFGDVKLSGVLGFLLGFPEIIGGILLAFIFGGIGSLVYIAYKIATRQYKSMAAIPYAPYLVLGAAAFFFIPIF